MEQQTETTVAPKPRKKAKVAQRKVASKAVAIHKPAPPAAPQNFLQVIAQATLDPRCDVAKMQALLDMQERMEERSAKKAFTVAFNALQAELPIVIKDGKIDHGDGVTAKGNKKLKTSFATYPNLNRVCGPLLKKYGFTFSSAMEPEPTGTMVVKSTLEHIAGSSRSTSFRLTADATGGKNNQQGWGSSQQYGMRYNMIALLNIVSEAKEDVDNDVFPKTDDSPVSEAQLKALIKLADDAGADKERFCIVMNVDSMADISASRFAEAKTQLERKLKAKQKRAGEFPGDRK